MINATMLLKFLSVLNKPIPASDLRRVGMQDAPLYASSNQMQRRDASLALAAHLPTMTWKPGTVIDELRIKFDQ